MFTPPAACVNGPLPSASSGAPPGMLGWKPSMPSACLPGDGRRMASRQARAAAALPSANAGSWRGPNDAVGPAAPWLSGGLPAGTAATGTAVVISGQAGTVAFVCGLLELACGGRHAGPGNGAV
jgi:hypothetical protein